ncbi:MAG: lipoyl synthase, partial [Planctomycetota bacterium]|nr:lipoyl synthase [Planctomycetota bacterium]
MNLPILQSPIMDLSRQRKPPWLKVRLPGGGDSPKLHKLFTSLKLHTVCEEAHCPNQAECWAHGTATFMILGDICTRSCGFCAVKTGRPLELDWDEPRRVAEAVAAIDLQYVVITSVNRDEVEHGGAPIFTETVRQIREMSPGIQIELLIP